MHRLSGAISMLTGSQFRQTSDTGDEKMSRMWECLEEGRMLQWSCGGCSHLNAEVTERCDACGLPWAMSVRQTVRGNDGPILERIVVVDDGPRSWELSPAQFPPQSNQTTASLGVCALAERICVVGSFVEVYCDDNEWHRARVVRLHGARVDIIFECIGIAATIETLDFPEDLSQVRPATVGDFCSQSKGRSDSSSTNASDGGDFQDESEYSEYSEYDEYDEYDSEYDEYSESNDAEDENESDAGYVEKVDSELKKKYVGKDEPQCGADDEGACEQRKKDDEDVHVGTPQGEDELEEGCIADGEGAREHKRAFRRKLTWRQRQRQHCPHQFEPVLLDATTDA